METTQTRCGFIAIIGAPNAGKSTLLNRLVGEKVAIVTHKVQTTRTQIRGIALCGDSQVIFVDTPGIFAPRRALDRAMVATAIAQTSQCDHTLALVDAKIGKTEEVDRLLAALREHHPKASLALNKIDLIDRKALLALAKTLNEGYPFEQTFMISAQTGSGVEGCFSALARRMPFGPWLYPEDQIADFPQRTLAAEITREKIYERLHQEIPYACHTETLAWKERPDGSVVIEQVIYVERTGQKKIVLGQGGQTVKAIGQAARIELSKHLGRPVHLFLFVKVKEKWSSEEKELRRFGF